MKKKLANASYELPLIKITQNTKRILALDPGSRNMGISLVSYHPATEEICVSVNSIVTSPLADIRFFNAQRNVFLDEVGRWIKLYEPHGIVAERFQSRGLKGSTIELVNLMLGLLGGRYSLPILLITPVTWKNDWHRRFKNDSLKLNDLYKTCRTTPHQLDSSFIGCYGLEIGIQQNLNYDCRSIVKQVEKTSCLRLINRKVS